VLGASTLNEVNQTVYNKINNKQFLSKLSDTDITQLANLTVDATESKEIMLSNISLLTESEISAELKGKLHSMSKEQLVDLSNLDITQLSAMRTEAEREIKQDNYNTLGKSFLNGLTADEITKIEEIDFSKEDPYEGVTISDDLKDKLKSLSATQKSTIDNLEISDLTSFKELAAVQIPHDEKKAAKEAAETALEAGQARYNKAIDTLAKATADATKAGVLNSDGSVNETVVNAAPKTQAVTMTSTINVDDMMTKIKEFVTTYNGLIKDLSDQTKQSKYRDYAPLTAEQKEDMSENEIKLWEEKAKSGLLRNDSLIRDGLSKMRSLIYQSNAGLEGSKYNTLFNIGITSSKNYNEGGTLEIDEVKLRKAIEEDPDAVERLFKNSDGVKNDPAHGGADTRGYLDKLRESMKSFEINIEKKAGRSTMTDAQYVLGKSLTDIETRISAWQDKLENIESRYWKQFTAMETAINKANQQSSLFTQG
jgi:flagellar hook-associated protein 2